MNNHEIEREARLQEQAELAERQGSPAGADPGLDSYRLVIRALRQPLPAQLPADFAALVAKRLFVPEEKGSLEDWLVTLLMLAMAVSGVIYVRPLMADIASRLHFTLPTLPWPLLGAAIVSVVLAWAVDRGAQNWRHGGRHGHNA
jgi:hypothetical protein